MLQNMKKTNFTQWSKKMKREMKTKSNQNTKQK